MWGTFICDIWCSLRFQGLSLHLVHCLSWFDVSARVLIRSLLLHFTVVNGHIWPGGACYGHTFGGLQADHQSLWVKFGGKLKVSVTNRKSSKDVLTENIQICGTSYNSAIEILFKQLLQFKDDNLDTKMLIFFRAFNHIIIVSQSLDNKKVCVNWPWHEAENTGSRWHHPPINTRSKLATALVCITGSEQSRGQLEKDQGGRSFQRQREKICEPWPC